MLGLGGLGSLLGFPQHAILTLLELAQVPGVVKTVSEVGVRMKLGLGCRAEDPVESLRLKIVRKVVGSVAMVVGVAETCYDEVFVEPVGDGL